MTSTEIKVPRILPLGPPPVKKKKKKIIVPQRTPDGEDTERRLVKKKKRPPRDRSHSPRRTTTPRRERSPHRPHQGVMHFSNEDLKHARPRPNVVEFGHEGNAWGGGGGGPGAPEPIEPDEYKSVPVSGVDWKKVNEEEEPTTRPEYCYWCFRDDSIENPYDADLMRIWTNNIGSSSSMLAVEMVQDEYNKSIRPYLPVGMRLPWSKYNIAHHHIIHAPHVKSILMKDIRTVQTVKLAMENDELMTRETTNGKHRVNLPHLKQWTELLKVSTQLLSSAMAIAGRKTR